MSAKETEARQGKEHVNNQQSCLAFVVSDFDRIFTFLTAKIFWGNAEISFMIYSHDLKNLL